MSHPLPYVADFQLAQRCLDGDEQAARALVRDYRLPIIGLLIKRGVSESEALDTVNQLWAECINREDGKPGRLAAYTGECLLATYLNTVVFNMWFTARQKRLRRDRILASSMLSGPEREAAGMAFEEGEAEGDADAPLISLLREAIDAGARKCSAESFVVLQLTRFDGLIGEEVARMFGRRQGWVTRMRQRGEREWRAGIMAFLKEREPLLNLRWKDFIAMCSVATPSSLGAE